MPLHKQILFLPMRNALKVSSSRLSRSFFNTDTFLCFTSASKDGHYGRETRRRLSGRRVAVLGLAFKPETDDMREAVSLVRESLRRGSHIAVYDPKTIEQANSIFADTLTYAKSVLDCIQGTELCIIVTEWNDFKVLKPSDFRKRMRAPAIVDGRRTFDARKFPGVKYTAIGLGP